MCMAEELVYKHSQLYSILLEIGSYFSKEFIHCIHLFLK